MSIVLDAMGSDDRPDPEVQAALTASNQLDEMIILVGPEPILKEKLAALPGTNPKLEIVHAPEALDMSDHIVEARAKETKLHAHRDGTGQGR